MFQFKITKATRGSSVSKANKRGANSTRVLQTAEKARRSPSVFDHQWIFCTRANITFLTQLLSEGGLDDPEFYQQMLEEQTRQLKAALKGPSPPSSDHKSNESLDDELGGDNFNPDEIPVTTPAVESVAAPKQTLRRSARLSKGKAKEPAMFDDEFDKPETRIRGKGKGKQAVIPDPDPESEYEYEDDDSDIDEEDVDFFEDAHIYEDDHPQIQVDEAVELHDTVTASRDVPDRVRLQLSTSQV